MMPAKLTGKVKRPLVNNLWTLSFNIFLDLFWPIRCACCSKIGNYLCFDCYSNLVQHKGLCLKCGKPSIAGFTHARCSRARGLDRLWSAYEYGETAKKIIYSFKYENCQNVSLVLAGLIADSFSDDLSTFSDFILVPVPLHWFKRLQRGFNQSELIANALSNLWQISVVSDLLIRSAYTFSQTGLNKDERKQNVSSAFKLVEEKEDFAKGKKFILIDDVCTTGATLNACCDCLKRGGAEAVWAVTFAKD